MKIEILGPLDSDVRIEKQLKNIDGSLETKI